MLYMLNPNLTESDCLQIAEKNQQTRENLFELIRKSLDSAPPEQRAAMELEMVQVLCQILPFFL